MLRGGCVQKTHVGTRTRVQESHRCLFFGIPSPSAVHFHYSPALFKQGTLDLVVIQRWIRISAGTVCRIFRYSNIRILQLLRYLANIIRISKYPNTIRLLKYSSSIRILQYSSSIRILKYSNNNIRILKYSSNIRILKYSSSIRILKYSSSIRILKYLSGIRILKYSNNNIQILKYSKYIRSIGILVKYSNIKLFE